MSSRSFRACGLQISSAIITLRFVVLCQPLLRLPSHLVEIKRHCRAAGLALVPQLPEASDVLLAKLAFELPIADCFADDLACGCIFAGFNGGLEGGELLAGQGDADFLDIGQDASPILDWSKFYYLVAIMSIKTAIAIYQ